MKMFNRRASSGESKPEEVLEHLSIQEGDTIADVGSGGGYFTLAFARIVGETGRVYAIDTKAQNLDYVGKQAAGIGLHNVSTRLAQERRVDLPEGSVDLIFMRNVFHHIEEPSAYFAHLRPALKPQGRISIIDYRPQQGLSFRALFGHSTPEDIIVSEMERAGYERIERFAFLPEQTFNIFRAASAGNSADLE